MLTFASGANLNRIRLVHAAFALSGVAGLAYEVLWSRYLSLFVGHSAYAQVLVLAVYLGGMAVGSLAIANLSERTPRPLTWYAGAELVLAAFGLVFHPLFRGLTGLSYETVFPALESAPVVGAARWGIAGLMILPQAIVLGATFPLMAAGLVRHDADHPGRAVSRAYFLNTLGGAAGVLLTGFVLIGAVGLPGTSLSAAALNVAAAGLVWLAVRGMAPAAVTPDTPEGTPDAAQPDDAEGRRSSTWGALPAWAPEGPGLLRVMLVVSFGTAVASFAYEIGWIRMLSLLLGSATHAFELMLSAFILGIALGAWAIRDVTDRTAEPVRLLGWIQVAMGLAALLSLGVYLLLFGVTAGMVQSLTGRPGGYELFNLGRYALCLAVMLPATLLAGCTLPVAVGSLIRAGRGERAIGVVNGVNTLGAVLGAALAGLFALPFLGLEGLVIAGAAADVLLGLWLLERSARWSGRRRTALWAAAAAAAVAFVSVPALVDFDPARITSGVFRRGLLPTPGSRVPLFYRDGRTATVSAHVLMPAGVVVLSTNGKPDASLDSRYLVGRRDTLAELPIPTGRDFTMQILAPMVGLAHRPAARSIANIGHGSGLTAASFLTSLSLRRLVTVEIEPLMVEGSAVFLPANQAAFADPRVSIVLDDAKSFFSYSRERFDLVFSEPSNPWVSGVASLYTEEFYTRAAAALSEDGVFVQWIQTYEIDDPLFLSVVAALDAVFPSYRSYAVGDHDVVLVASLAPLASADWTVVESEAFRELTLGTPPFRAQHLAPLFLFDEATFRPLLDRGLVANSDYRPILDVGAERSRFAQRRAEGVASLGTSRVHLGRHIAGESGLEPVPYAMPPALGLVPSVLRERAAWLRGTLEAGGGAAPGEMPGWQDELVSLRRFFALEDLQPLLGSWEAWAGRFARAERALHWGMGGAIDSTFHRHVEAFLSEHDAPTEARAAVALVRSYQLDEWHGVADAVDMLLEPVARAEAWVPVPLLLDLAVLSYLEVDRPADARRALELLGPHTGRAEGNVRDALLRALVEEASSSSR